VPTKVSLPVGARVTLLVQGRNALIGWDHQYAGGAHHDHLHDHAETG